MSAAVEGLLKALQHAVASQLLYPPEHPLLVEAADRVVADDDAIGDPLQRAAHRKLYQWAPLVAAVAITIGLSVSLTLVGAMAALWNAEHTLMQRYGLMRIYGRKVGDQNGPLEKPMLIVWLIAAVASGPPKARSSPGPEPDSSSASSTSVARL